MLNKEACKKCWNDFALYMRQDSIGWQSKDEELWADGMLWCRGSGKMVSIYDACSNDCHYELEHLMGEQDQ